jgi:hypothetical protein
VGWDGSLRFNPQLLLDPVDSCREVGKNPPDGFEIVMRWVHNRSIELSAKNALCARYFYIDFFCRKIA